MKKQIHSYQELAQHLVHQVNNSQDIYLTDCKFLFDIKMSELSLITTPLADKIIHRAINIRNCQFKKIEINDTTFEKSITIVSSSFQEIHVYSSIFHQEIRIVDSNSTCLFLGYCEFHNNASLGFNPKQITHIVDIDDCVFDKSIEFSNLLMSEAGEDITYNRPSSFDIYGEDTIIKHNLIIRDSMFIGSTLDIRCDIGKELQLYSINDVDDESIKIKGYFGTLRLHASRISILNIIQCNFATIDIANSTIQDIIESKLQCVRMTNDAALIFRDNAIRHSNPILENEYTAKLYDNLLREKTSTLFSSWIDSIKKRKSYIWGNKKTLYNYLEPIILFFPSMLSGERFLLWLNKYSNDFNRSWTRGIIFTLLSTLVFYFIINYLGTNPQYFVIDFKFHNFDKVLEGYMSLLDIFNISNIDQPMQLTIWGKILLFIAKILIAYGSWQTIYAFYKFKR